MRSATERPDPRTRHDLSAAEKAAALLLSMDKSVSSRVLSYFGEPDVAQLAQVAARLGSLPKSELDALVSEFAAAVAMGADLEGGQDAVTELLDGVLPPDQLSTLFLSAPTTSAPVDVAGMLRAATPAQLAGLARKYPAQAAAYMVSRFDGTQAANVLGELPDPLRVDLVRRILALQDVTDAARAILDAQIAADLGDPQARATKPNAHARVASVLNKMGRDVADATFNGLAQIRPRDAEKIKTLLFNFDDIVRLSDADRTKLFEEISVELTIAALRGAQEPLMGMILASQSQRARRMIEGELQSGRPMAKAEIDQAQRTIADRALDLGERGVISLGGAAEE